jgi:hypothetical protein
MSQATKEALQKWLRRPLAALRELLRCSFIPYKLRASKSTRLALGHSRTLLQSFRNSVRLKLATSNTTGTSRHSLQSHSAIG